MNDTYQPFPGLRAYSFQERTFFSGRESQKHQLLRIITGCNFVTVVGESGVGKTSFINSKIIPRLLEGFVVKGKRNWRIASFRPGKKPISALATALSSVDVVRRSDEEKIDPNLLEQFEQLLKGRNHGIVEIAETYKLTDEDNLLIYIDHLDDLLVYDGNESESIKLEINLFVKRLVEVFNQSAYAITILATIRTENTGRFSRFPSLAEAINKNQFLLSALEIGDLVTIFDQIAKDGEVRFDPSFLVYLRNFYTDNPLILGEFQHAMKRTVDLWKTKGTKVSISEEHLASVGGLNSTIAYHMDDIYGYMTEDNKRTTRLLFKAITDTSSSGGVRVIPRTVEEISAIALCPVDDIIEVARHFTDESCGVLRKNDLQDITGRLDHLDHLSENPSTTITAHSEITISREYVIDRWSRLNKWIKEEQLDASTYKDIVQDVVQNEPLYEGEKLISTWKWYEKTQPHAGWAKQYHKDFGLVEDFIIRSKERADKEQFRREAEERSRQKKSRRNRNIKLVFSIVSIILIAYAFRESRKASEERQSAIYEKSVADKAKKESDSAAVVAERSIQQAGFARREATRAISVAGRAMIQADSAQLEADKARRVASVSIARANRLDSTMSRRNEELVKAEENIEKSSTKLEYLDIVERVRDFADDADQNLDRLNNEYQLTDAAKSALKGYDEFQKLNSVEFVGVVDSSKDVTQKKLFSSLIKAYQRLERSQRKSIISYGNKISKMPGADEIDGVGQFIVSSNDDNSSLYTVSIENGTITNTQKITSAYDTERKIKGIKDISYSNSAEHLLVSHLPVEQSTRHLSKYDFRGKLLSAITMPSLVEKIYPYQRDAYILNDQNGNIYLVEGSATSIDTLQLHSFVTRLKAIDFNERQERFFAALPNQVIKELIINNKEMSEVGETTLTDFKSEISAIKYIDSKKWLVVGTRDGELLIYTLDTKELVYRSRRHGGNINCLVADNDERVLITGGRDRVLNIWSLEELTTYTSEEINRGLDYLPIKFELDESIRDVSFLGENWILVIYSTEILSPGGEGGVSLLPLDFDIAGDKLRELIE